MAPFMMTVSPDHPYHEKLEEFYLRDFPGAITTHTCAIFEAVSSIIMGTKQNRYGPKPKPEVQVGIREVIRTAIENDQPIPIFAPWGCRKQGNYDIDIAEAYALKQLLCLNKHVEEVYEQGIKVRIRLEDTTDMWLFSQEPFDQIAKYRDDFMKLVHIVGNDIVEVVTESSLMRLQEHQALATEAVDTFERYLLGESTELPKGWKGEIPQEQRDYYYRAYAQFYPDQSKERKLAEYFAATYARVMLGASGATDTHKDNIQVSFSLPVPGTPMANRRIYMRTVPKRYTSCHKPPWIAKGYLVIDEADNVKVKLAGWNERLPFMECSTEITNGRESITVQSDYVEV